MDSTSSSRAQDGRTAAAAAAGTKGGVSVSSEPKGDPMADDYAFLSEASRVLASSLDYETTLASVARLAVPHFADWCAIDIVVGEAETDAFSASPRYQRLAVAHVDPQKVAWAHEIARQYPSDPNARTGVPHVLRTGESEFYPDIPEELLIAAAKDEQHLSLMREIGFSAAMIVPLAARSRVLGAMTFVTAESGRRYTQSDLALAQEIARRAATAIDNAYLYRQAQIEIAERRRAEAALKTAEQQLRLVTDTVPTLLSYVDADRRYRFNNKPYSDWFGQSSREVVGKTVEEVVGAAAYARIAPYMDAALAGQEVTYEMLVPYRSGGQRYIHANYVPDRAEDGTVRGFVASVTDITRHKASEVALAEAEARLRTVISNVPIVVFALDRNGIFTFADGRGLESLGLSPERTLGRSVFDLYAREPESRKQIGSALAGQTVAWVSKVADAFFETQCTPLRDEAGRINGVIGVAYDISDRMRAESALQESQVRTRVFLRDVLMSVTEGRLRLCDGPDDLPPVLPRAEKPLTLEGAAGLRPMRRCAEAVMNDLGFASARRHDLLTAVSEAAMNAIVHAGGGRAVVSADPARGVVQVRIEDQGAGIAMDRLPRATLERGYSSAGTLGHGFWLMLKTSDRIFLLTGPTGTVVVLEQDRTVASPSWLRDEEDPEIAEILAADPG